MHFVLSLALKCPLAGVGFSDSLSFVPCSKYPFYFPLFWPNLNSYIFLYFSYEPGMTPASGIIEIFSLSFSSSMFSLPNSWSDSLAGQEELCFANCCRQGFGQKNLLINKFQSWNR